MIRKLFLIIVLILAFAISSWATTYTVCSSGCDETTIQAVFDNNDLGADDVVEVQADSPGGTATFREMVTWGANDEGSAGQPVILQGRTGDTVEVNGADILTTWSESSGTVDIPAESQTLSNIESIMTKGSNGHVIGQGVMSTTELTVPKVDMYIKKVGSPEGDVWVELWATTGTPSRPTGGTPIANGTSDTVDASTVDTSIEWVSFAFSSSPTMSANTDYFLIFMADYDDSDSDCVTWGLQTASPPYRGDDPYARHELTIATPPVRAGGWDQDFAFKIYKTVAATTYEKSGVTTEPDQVFYDDTALTENDGYTKACSSNEWDWASDVLYVNVGEDPDDGTLEATQRASCIVTGALDYMTIDNIDMTKTIQYGVNALSAQYLTVQNCDISYTGDGLVFGTTSGDNLVQDNTIHHNNQSGIWTWKDAGTSGHENIIRRNTVHTNHQYGMMITSNYYIIDYNEVYDNGNTTDTCSGIEICNYDNDGYAQYITVKYNWVYGTLSGVNDGAGINLDDYATHVDAYGNVSYSNDGSGIGVWKANNLNIYNNTMYNNAQDSSGTHTVFAEAGASSDAEDLSNLVFYNNIAVATGENTYAIYFDAEAEGSTGLDVSNNCWYATATNWYYWNAAGGSNLATWNALTGIGTDINSDPLMTDAANYDFTLKGGSPCIDTGENRGSTYDDALSYTTSSSDFGTANAVDLEDQDNDGKWDIGAYRYPKWGAPICF